MAIDLSQNTVIDNLNDYLKGQNLPLELSNEGVCNGLAMVYAKYCLSNERKDFLEILGYISSKKIPKDKEDKVNDFAAQILVSFKPEVYNKKLNQTNSYQTQSINNKPLKSVFELPLVTVDNNWELIIGDIDLQDDEVMLIHGLNHTVSVTKKDGKYIVYDPNYEKGEKSFASESLLVKELHKKVFGYTTKEMSLMISVVTSDDNQPRQSLPKVDAIYDSYLNTNNISTRASIADQNKCTLEIAALYNNENTIKKLLDLGEKNPINVFHAASNAVINNNTESLKPLIDFLTSEQEDDKVKQDDEKVERNLQILILLSLINGRKEVFDFFKDNESTKDYFDELFKDDENMVVIFSSAAEGGNHELLQQSIDLFKNCKHVSDHLIASAFLKERKGKSNVLMSAIKGNDPKCLEIILKQMDKVGYEVPPQQMLGCLLLAIKKNEPLMVQRLLEKMPDELVNTVSLNLPAVEKTNLEILNSLKEKGMTFSDKAKDVIARKNREPVGLMLSIGIAIKTFSDFCKEELLHQKGFSYDNTKLTKLTLLSQKSEEPDDDVPVERLNMKVRID